MQDKTLYEMIFESRMNIHYHESKEDFYSKFLNWTAFLSIILSSAAFSSIFSTIGKAVFDNPEWLVLICTFAVAVLNGAVLAFGFQQKMISHSGFKKRWTELLSECQVSAEQDRPELVKKFYGIISEEPPPDKKLLDKAYHATNAMMGIGERLKERAGAAR